MSEMQQGTLVRDRYRLKEYKGSGSFGEVWLAQDEVLDIEVAIKVYISLDQRGIKEFQNEYKAAYGLHHPNLLVTDYFDVWQQRPYLVMKYCRTGSVAACAGEISEPELWKFIRDVSQGLAYLHAQEPDPIVHQDIKPDNILIDEHGTYLITDFGISRRIRSTMRKQSRRASTAGAVAYMGPERFSEDPTPIMASDIWSLGASIYELATGYLPFDGLGGGHQLNGARRPRLHDPWSTDLSDCIRACLALNTWERPRAAQLADYAAAKVRGESPEAPWHDSPAGSSADGTPAGHAYSLGQPAEEDKDPRRTQRHTTPNPLDQDGGDANFHGRATVKQNLGGSLADATSPSQPPSPSSSSSQSQQPQVSACRRHGLVSFVLVTLMALFGFGVIFFAFDMIDQYWLGSHYEDYCIGYCICALAGLYGLFLLWKWKRVGYYLVLLAGVGLLFWPAMNWAHYDSDWYRFLGYIHYWYFIDNPFRLADIIAVLCLSGVLYVKKDGVPTWKQLEDGWSFRTNKVMQVATLSCLALVVLIWGVKHSRASSYQMREYSELVAECNLLIQNAGTTNVELAAQAQEKLSSIKSAERGHRHNSNYTQSEELQAKLDRNKPQLFNSAVSAAREARRSNDLATAADKYQAALRLRSDDEVRDELEQIKEEVGYVIITGIEFANHKAGGEVIEGYGNVHKASTIHFLHARIDVRSLVSTGMKEVKFDIKLYLPNGNLSRGSKSPSRYTRSEECTVRSGTTQISLGGWGTEGGGYYSAGNYRYEIWHNGHKLYSKTFTLN